MSALAAPVVRYCFVRLLDEVAGEREAKAHALAAELAILCAPCPVWVGVPGDESAARWDLSLMIGLPDLATWQALEASSAFTELIGRLTAEAKVVKAWTFAQPAAATTSTSVPAA